MSHNHHQSPPPPTPNCTVDPYHHLHLTRRPDGTLIRHTQPPTVPASADPATSSPALSKDLPLDPALNTRLRLYLPKNLPESTAKLPVVLYFHGGGFVIMSADTAIVDGFCAALADRAAALVVSLDYRLAPEHRLPAAYDDAAAALAWLARRFDEEEWLRHHGDASRVFLMGDSAGANMAYNLALRIASGQEGPLGLVRIRGLILHNPFFGGPDRTGSELRLVNDPILPLSVTDMLWELALPEGAGRGHEYCWIRASGSDPVLLELIKELGWRVLVTGYGGDPLFDRQVEVAKLLEEKGVEVVGHFAEEGYHVMELFEPAKAQPLLLVLKSFMDSC